MLATLWCTFESKLKENPKLSKQYKEQIASYAEKGYARKLSPEQVKNKNEKTW